MKLLKYDRFLENLNNKNIGYLFESTPPNQRIMKPGFNLTVDGKLDPNPLTKIKYPNRRTLYFSEEQSTEKFEIMKDIMRNQFPKKTGNVFNGVNFDNIISKFFDNRMLVLFIIQLAEQQDDIIIRNAKEYEAYILIYQEELFNPNGKNFQAILDFMMEKSKKGDEMEKVGYKFFTKWIKDTYNSSIKILPPTHNQDINGVDGIFFVDRKRYTIQVKKGASIIKGDNSFKISINGGYTKIKTDYLVVVFDNSRYESAIFIGDNVEVINFGGISYYNVPIDDMLYYELLSRDYFN
jgi:hypothetical protein